MAETIRLAVVQDIQSLNRLLSQVLDVHSRIRPDLFKSGQKKYNDAQLRAILNDSNRPVFVFESDGKVLGYAFCIFIRHIEDNILTDIKTLYIDDLCVDENARGKHIGQKLYDFVLDFAKKQNCYNVTLNVWEGNDSAIKFYDKMGLKLQKRVMEHIL